jgi:hypothetical protein
MTANVSSYADGQVGAAANGGMTPTTATDMSHYAYRAAVYRLAMDNGDPQRNQRRLTALHNSFAPPRTYAVTGNTVAVSVVDIG